MRLDRLQDALLAHLYDAWFKPWREYVVAEEIAVALGSSRELGTRAAEELVDAGLAISPIIDREANHLMITVAGILDAERRQLGNPGTRERQQTLRRRVVQAIVREREAHGPNHPIDAAAIRRELNYGEEEFLANVDVMIDQGFIEPYGGTSALFTATRVARALFRS